MSWGCYMARQRRRLRILITAKTYPIPSSKYDELVCTAAVTEAGGFIRLYPINFRELSYDQKYKKYQWIEVDAVKHTSRDARKESYRPDCDTIQVLGNPIPTKRGDWSGRAKYVLARESQSMEDLHDQQALDRTSLGVFRPREVHDLIIRPDTQDWKPGFKAALQQQRLFETRKATLQPPRKVPFKFLYRFECDDPRCNGHQMSIVDWEVGRLFWRLVDSGKSHPEAAEMVRKTFFNRICGPDKDTRFLVGTILAHPKTWLVIGAFYPKKREPEGDDQLRLFGA